MVFAVRVYLSHVLHLCFTCFLFVKYFVLFVLDFEFKGK